MMVDVLRSPSALILLTTVMFIVALQILGDIKEARQHAKAKKLRATLKRSPRTVVSIVIDVCNDSVFQTLESLEQNSYQHLEIIVFVKSRSKRLLNELRSYQRRSRFTGFRVITARERLTQAQFIKKYARGSLVMSLGAGNTVDTQFITNHVIHFRSLSLQAIVANETVIMGNNLKSALRVGQKTMLGYLGRVRAPRLFLTSRLRPATIYKKKAVISNKQGQKPVESLYVDKILVISLEAGSAANAQSHQSRYAPPLVMGITLTLVGLSEGVDQTLFTLRVMTAIALVVGLLMWQRGGAIRFTSKLSVALLTPFTILWPQVYTDLDAKR